MIYIVNTLLRYFLAADRKEREKKSFRIPAMVPIIFYNGAEEWTAVRSLKEYQKEGDLFGEHILNLQYYLVDLNAVEEEYILSTNTVLDNIMYCDKFRMKEQLANALRKAFKRVSVLDKQEQEAFRGWVKHILMEVCEYKESVADEIINWAGNGVDDMSFQYNIVRMFEKEREEGREIIVQNLIKRGMTDEEIRSITECRQQTIDESRKKLGMNMC
ncbi:MAG: Rpn family recombination-promoting nuclease/putative transposase [Lachnospiraceae bacterium]|nr:Rpn family recombination-promoting nuclease/putative transposase [Lachnospiraceae bacterium]